MKIQLGRVDVKCPKCGSHNVVASRRGYSIGLALLCVAATYVIISHSLLLFFAVPILLLSLLWGFSGAGKIKLTCVDCGHSWPTKPTLGYKMTHGMLDKPEDSTLKSWADGWADREKYNDEVLGNGKGRRG